MSKRAKLLIAASAMLYVGFLAQKLALAYEFTVGEAAGIAVFCFLFSAGLFAILTLLRARRVERGSRRWQRVPIAALLAAAILTSFGLAWLGLGLEKSGRENRDRETLAEQDRVRRAWADRLREFEPITASGGDVFFDFEMWGVSGSILDYMAGKPNPSSQVHCVYFRDVAVTDAAMDCIASLPELKRLDLRSVRISDANLQRLKELRQLQYLTLEKTPVDDAALQALEGHSGLLEVDLSGTNVTDNGLKHLSKNSGLRGLCLTSTRVTDAGLASLRVFPKLSVVNVRNTAVTEAGATALQQALPQVRIYGLR